MGRRARCKARLRDTVLRIERYGLGRRLKDRGLVHIIPKTGDACCREISIQSPPPSTRVAAGEIGKYRGAGPDGADVERAVGPLEEMVAGGAAVIRRISLTRRRGNMQVGDDMHFGGGHIAIPGLLEA